MSAADMHLPGDWTWHNQRNGLTHERARWRELMQSRKLYYNIALARLSLIFFNNFVNSLIFDQIFLDHKFPFAFSMWIDREWRD